MSETKYVTKYGKHRREVVQPKPNAIKAKQSFKDECDINLMMERAARTGQIPTYGGQPQYGDFAAMPESYLEAHALVQRAEAAFNALPAETRLECGNDPAVFLALSQDPEWAKKHGLTKEAPPSPAEPAPAPQSAPKASNPPSAKKTEGNTQAPKEGA